MNSLGDIGAVPTFIGSGILFLASGTMVVTCANAMFEKRRGVFVYKTMSALRLRGMLRGFANFLIMSYSVLFATFFLHQFCRIFEVTPKGIFVVLLDEKNIYIMQILLFPAAVLFAAFLVRLYIGIRNR